jgi:hypothetical protein
VLPKSIKIKIYKTIIFPLVLYWCEIWSLILGEEYRLRVFEKRVLRRISGSTWDEIVGGWRTLHNEEPHDLYSSPNIVRMIKSRRMGWPGHVPRIGEERNAYRVWWETPKGRYHYENLDVGGRIIFK